MKLSLGFCTSRPEPHLDWLAETLAPQKKPGDEIELIIIDSLHGQRTSGPLGPPAHPRPFDRVVISLPMPSIWQGPHRVTSCDWWALGNARNTAFVLASHDYVAFVDDRCKLGPLWLETVRNGEAARASVLAGSYDKIEYFNGPQGPVTTTPDGRRKLAPRGRINCDKAWCYGCTFALPLEWALEVNGHEAGCDGLGMEDCIFSLMLANAGHRIDYVPDMFVALERPIEPEATHNCKRTDKGVSPNDKSNSALKRFGRRKRTEFTQDLRALRAAAKTGVPFPVPDPMYSWRDWYDDQPIKALV
jgi:hypothetical protein